MLKNYLKIAFRNLLKNKVYSFINIGGLAVGMAVAMLIGLWIRDEISFNQYHHNYDKIAQVMMKSTKPGTGITKENSGLWLPVEDILKNNYGQYFEKVATIWNKGGMTLKVKNQNFTKIGNYIGADVLDMLSLEMIYGSTQSLADPHSIVISETTAKAIFGDSNPVNQAIKIENKIDVIVTGVYKNLPKNSTFGDLDFIAPFELWKISNEWVRESGWNSVAFNFLVKLAPNVTIEQANAGFKDLFLKYGPPETAEENAKYKPEFYLYPMKDWHLYSEFSNGVPVGGKITFVWMFGLIGIFVLLLACINFMNLSTARSEYRAKEVGVRKAIGSKRVQLVNQFFTESYLVVMLAFVLAFVGVYLSLDKFNQITDKSIQLPIDNPSFWLVSILFIVLTGFMSGIYPAFYLSSFQPIKILKGTFKAGKLAAVPRKVLVVVQFTVSITLIIGTIIVYKQIIHAQGRPIGYDKNRLISVPITDPNYRGKHELLKTQLLNTGLVSDVTFSFSPLTQVWENISGYTWQGKDPEHESNFAIQLISYDFGKTIDWKIIQGRDYSRAFATDSAGLIINEAAAKYLGLKDPVGQRIYKNDDNSFVTIIGVVKDLIMSSPYEPVKQTFFFLDKNYSSTSQVHFKLKPEVAANTAIQKTEAIFKKIVPSASFNYKFVDDDYNAKFKTEQRIGTLASIFASLAILISCLGLFGLASFVAEQRTKEIGIRKVLGASITNLWQMLSKDFVLLVILSCIVAAPIAYYFMSQWLQKYNYRTEISWWIFVVTGIGALSITLLTVSYQAIKAALMNPVKSLKTE
jgi:putative ABC transport system permease protein